MQETRAIQKAISEVSERIAAACGRVGRNPDEVTLIAVSKTMPVEAIREAMACGMIEFGENRPQELRDKQAEISEPLHWHMIGSLQTNKLKYVIGKTVLIHSVDSVTLAKAIAEMSEKKEIVTDILLEVNIAGEESKHGLAPEQVVQAVQEIARLSHIRVRGLMTVAPYTEDAEKNRIYFRKMKQLMVDINSKNIDNIDMDMLSMGMTGDYEIAVEEGATLVRVGTGIFGHRVYLPKE
ncbi:MAG: YggS family pyridoxal phosphate-dependent enzyme [Lachnospiraceae bacterium]|nr:YggS family pyridoxal phosphate-dependent enzyme [Lachnospiraceae bacterium]